MAASHHGDTPYSGNSVTSVPVTPYTTSVDVNSFERVHSNEPVLRLPDVSMFGLAASTVLHGGFGLSAIHGDVRPLEEALEIMLQV